MGIISLDQLLPKHLTRPDDASPISAMGLPRTGFVTLIGFDRRPREPICIEAEVPVHLRFCQRRWEYRLRGDQIKNQDGGKPNTRASAGRGGRIYETNRWRLEIAIDVKKAGPVKPAHMAVVAQIPYGNGWVQASSFKMYSKKKRVQDESQSGVLILDNAEDVEGKLEMAISHDLWETSHRYVAGISFPNGYRGIISSYPRNTPIDFVFGACPDFIGLRNEVMTSPEIQDLLNKTQRGALAFWRRGKVHGRPRLHENTRTAASALMLLSVEQSLAGPAKGVRQWIGKPLWKLVEYRYCNHLNNANRKEDRRSEDQLNERYDT